MRNANGTFVKGERASPGTEFKPGQHWRPRKPHWDRDWLHREYIDNERSSSEIADEVGCKPNNIHFWLKKHGIPRRSVSEARKLKHWGAEGEANPMYGRNGSDHPNWKGGITPERQRVYSSREWADAVRTVWERDQGICQTCGKHETNRRRMHVHHIEGFDECPERRCDPENLALTCSGCHAEEHTRRRREKKRGDASDG